MLEIERRLLIPRGGQARNILLPCGMGGVGKTTLLGHLAAWWQTTHLVERVFSFEYNERAWTRQQIVRTIAAQLVGKERYKREYQPLSVEAQQEKLTALPRATRHLLILDNLESITGTHFAIRNTLSARDQEHLRRFLVDLAGGKTLVLLGSRGDEAWLAPGTFVDNRYELAGLDPEAAAQLTGRILERHNVTHYRQDKDLQHLLALLAGFPLALEVVLANLTRQTPTEILAALQSGDISIDTGDTTDKTASILRCIEYSHSNLSTDAQNLLLCLAPFTSVINTDWLRGYTEFLKRQPLLAKLPFDRWAEVLREAQNWGLIAPDKNIPGYMHLRPVFPYFLQNRLRASGQEEHRAAIEAAFRLHYAAIGNAICEFLLSKGPDERLLGQLLARLEYENLPMALHVVLAAQESIFAPYQALNRYLNQTQERQRGLDLAQMVWASLQAYPIGKEVP